MYMKLAQPKNLTVQIRKKKDQCFLFQNWKYKTLFSSTGYFDEWLPQVFSCTTTTFWNFTANVKVRRNSSR